jgi:hypothetical protein
MENGKQNYELYKGMRIIDNHDETMVDMMNWDPIHQQWYVVGVFENTESCKEFIDTFLIEVK